MNIIEFEMCVNGKPTSNTKNTKNMYAMKNIGPNILLACSIAKYWKSPKIVRIIVKMESVKVRKSGFTVPKSK